MSLDRVFGDADWHIAVWVQNDSLLIVSSPETIMVSEALLESLERGHGHRDVCWGDNILTIRGTNRTVSYGVGKRIDGKPGLRVGTLSPEIAAT